MNESIMITGADGYFGKLLTVKYLTQTDNKVFLWVRAQDHDEYQSKRDLLSHAYAAYANRISIHSGDLKSDQPFSTINPSEVTTLIHTAAITRFNVEEPLANAVNREGTRKTAEFAIRCPKLEQFGFVSTIYSSGLAPGCVAEPNSRICPGISFAPQP
jgi:thioester reductase-like protein